MLINQSKSLVNFLCFFQSYPRSPLSDLPPSEGGKYTGFGNTPAPPPRDQEEDSGDTWASLASGWTSFTSAASTWASKVGEKASGVGSSINQSVIKPSGEQVNFQVFVCVCVCVCVDHEVIEVIIHFPQMSKFGTYVNDAVIKPTKQKVFTTFVLYVHSV